MKIRNMPCGECDCGTYSIEASLNKKARMFGALEENDRFDAIPICKKDNSLLCAGCNDFHVALVELDSRLSKRSER